MKKQIKRFDVNKKPRNRRLYAKLVADLLAIPAYKKHAPIVTKEGIDDLKGPYLLLCNHNGFIDFQIAHMLTRKRKTNFVAAIGAYIGKEKLMRDVGCICKRKFTNDIALIKQLSEVVKMGNILIMYPEARYSFDGTTQVLPASLGKLVKFLKVPVATLMCHGNHITKPFWDQTHDRGVKPLEAEFKLLFNKEQVETLSKEEIFERIEKEFIFDDYAWQKERNVLINEEKRAEGLHRILYKCPKCGQEYEMSTSGSVLKCNHCGAEWEMTPLGELKAKEGEDVFTHIPTWFKWERECVRKEIEEGKYSSGVLDVEIESLPNPKKFIKFGKGTLVHDLNGFTVKGVDFDGDPIEMILPASTMYACDCELNYKNKGDCLDLSTLDDTWFIYPKNKNCSVTKMTLACEEIYKYLQTK